VNGNSAFTDASLAIRDHNNHERDTTSSLASWQALFHAGQQPYLPARWLSYRLASRQSVLLSCFLAGLSTVRLVSSQAGQLVSLKAVMQDSMTSSLKAVLR
jgi:hypothetical protein